MRRGIYPDELDAIYRLIGKGVWQLQNVEDALQTLLALRDIKEPGTVTQAQAQSILSKHRRHTLGTAMRLIGEHDALPAELFASLGRWKEERDWLIHRVTHECRHEMYTDEGRTGLFQRLHKFAEDGHVLQKSVGNVLAIWCESKGVDPAAAEELAIRQIAALRGELDLQ